MAHPLISIITITYNAEKEIIPTVESVSEQTFKDFEHIIIDGQSSDRTLQNAKDFSQHPLVILSEPDEGLYDAMNKGLKMAKGRYVIFLNAGDSFHSPEILELYAREAAAGADIIYSDTVIVDSQRNVIGPRHLSVPDKLTHDSFAKGMLICHQAFMVRRELAPEYNMDYRFSADYDWTIRCIDNSDPDKCRNLKTIGIDYLSEGMTDKNKVASLKERYRIMSARYGTIKTFVNHVGFVGRAVKRRFLKN